MYNRKSVPDTMNEKSNSPDQDHLSSKGSHLNITIPRWAQMVGLPILALLVWFTASALIQVLFIFATSTVIALMINPLVKKLERFKIPRYISVFVVFLSLLALIVAFFIFVIPPTINQLQELVQNLPDYTDTIR